MQGSRDDFPGGPDGTPTRPGGVDGSGKAVRLPRLKKRADFLRAGRGRRLHGRVFSLHVAEPEHPDENHPPARFGLTVTRKVGGAVERNRIKRRLREALKSAALAPRRGSDYVIVARREALTVPFQNLIADLNRMLDRSREEGRPKGSRRSNPGSKARNATRPISPS